MFNIFRNKEKENKKKPKGIEDYLIDAFDAYESGNFIEAYRQFEAIGAVDPYHPIANLMAGRAHIALGNYEKAIDCLFKHLKAQPESVEALIYLGFTYYECGELEQAVERYEQALKLKENSVLVKENLAITRFSAGDLDEAIDELVELHQSSPEDPSITELLVLALGKKGNWETARQYASKLEGFNFDAFQKKT